MQSKLKPANKSAITDTSDAKPGRKRSGEVAIIRPGIFIGNSISIGPGKIELLRKISELNSISAAARALGMQYKNAWLVIESLNHGFGKAVVATVKGGKGGGGAQLTELGGDILATYSALEARINTAASIELARLVQLASAAQAEKD